MTNEEVITKIVEQDEDFCIITDAVNGTVNIEVSLDWWKKQSNSDEDCISRTEAIKAIRNYNVTIEVGRAIGKSQLADIVDSINKVQEKMISELPSIQQKPKTGHWEQYGYSWNDKFKCSECGEEQPKILCGERIIGHWSDYCPNCGADMRESEE